MPISEMQKWLDKLDSLLPNIAVPPDIPILSEVPKVILILALVLPVVLALFSRRIVIVLGTLLILGTAVLFLVQPATHTMTAIASAYAGSILIAIFGIQSKRKSIANHAEFMDLRTELNNLRNAVERQYLADLKRRGRKSDDRN
jgi:hypothetical protein